MGGETVRNSIWAKRTETKSFSFRSPGGGSGVFYAAGYYFAPVADANLDEGGATINLGTASASYAAHAFIVAGGAGTVAVGAGNQVGIRANGVTITDEGVRTAGDSEVLTEDITSLALNQYLETDKKFLGIVQFELYIVGGAPATYSLDFNYGLAKYEDAINTNFILTGVECVGRAGAADVSFNIEFLHHKAIGWTYDAAAFAPGAEIFVDMNTDHGVQKNLANGEPFAYKRSNLGETINGKANEGLVIRITTGANNSVESMDLHIIYRELS